MIYKWKSSGGLALPAQVVGEELERIRVANNGRLEGELVVERARDKANPLHPAFEWNDKKAAHAFRVDQARYLIRHIEVVVAEKPDAPPTRAFVSVVRDKDRSYTSVQHAMSDEELRQQVLAQAWAELEAWRKRYAELAELADVFASIDKARAA
ncbi:hypothetical protein J2792_002327 [Novosphingobium capsulatum]|jgi:hypothetical protein|uniref:Uncharacterized protein n=1 Tax=Novosphingobium capsulatum TaxID=13688 RepID=A0ABU1MM89_9SPHN|nr:hypothetical protein [Novosphingobium capsulatum]MDR6511455.1 hypothetical protein [Novosphingobium capsulatum]